MNNTGIDLYNKMTGEVVSGTLSGQQKMRELMSLSAGGGNLGPGQVLAGNRYMDGLNHLTQLGRFNNRSPFAINFNNSAGLVPVVLLFGGAASRLQAAFDIISNTPTAIILEANATNFALNAATYLLMGSTRFQYAALASYIDNYTMNGLTFRYNVANPADLVTKVLTSYTVDGGGNPTSNPVPSSVFNAPTNFQTTVRDFNLGGMLLGSDMALAVPIAPGEVASIGVLLSDSVYGVITE
jgi:hypothetical protein